MNDKRKDRKIIEEIGDNNYFQYRTVEKVLWLSDVVERFANSKIAKDFALIGGSAIVFLGEKMYRLSQDLDLDFIADPELGKAGEEDIKDLQNEHKKVIEEISKNLEMQFKPKPQEDSRLLQMELKYRSNYSTKLQSVELDLGYRYCHSVLDVEKKPWILPFEIEEKREIIVQTLASEEIWASKLVATLARERIDSEGKHFLMSKNKIRHLFDIYWLSSEILPKGEKKIDIDLLKRIFILFGTTRIKHFEFCRGDSIDLYTDEEYDTELHPVLRTDQSYVTLIEIKREVMKFLDKYIYTGWTKDTYRFFESYGDGRFHPDDIFDDQKIVEKLEKMYYYSEILGKVERKKDGPGKEEVSKK